MALSQCTRTLHKKLDVDGITNAQHKEILARENELMWTDPSKLLDKHKYICSMLTFISSRKATTQVIDRTGLPPWNLPYLSAAEFVRDDKVYSGDPGSFNFPDQSMTTNSFLLSAADSALAMDTTDEMLMNNPPTSKTFQSPQSTNNPLPDRSVGISLQLSHSVRSSRMRFNETHESLC